MAPYKRGMIGELEFFGGKGRASGSGLQVQSLGVESILNALISDGKTMHFRTFVENIFWMQSVRVAEPEGERHGRGTGRRRSTILS